MALALAKVSHQHNREAGGHWPPSLLLSMSWDVTRTENTDLGLNAGKWNPRKSLETFTLHISIFLYIHADRYPTLRSTIVCRMTKIYSEHSIRHTCYCVCQCWMCRCISSYTSTVLVVVLSDFHSCFQLLSLSQLCLFSSLVRWSRKMLLMIWYDMSLLYAGLNNIPLPCQGRDFGQPITWAPPYDLCLFEILHSSLVT